MTREPNPDIFRPIDVPDPLKPYVRRVLCADISEPIDIEIDIRATGYHYLGWVWRGRWQGEVNGDTQFDSDKDGPIVLAGQIAKSVVTARMQRDFGQIFLEFTALGHFQVLGIGGLQQACAPHVLNPALKPYFEKLFVAKELTEIARIALLADVISAIPKHTVSDEMITAIERIEAVDGDLRIAELVSELGLGERQFRAVFERHIGLTPKAFCRTLQINRALNQLLVSNGKDLAGIAAQSGFSDQAHFTRAFGDFLGEAPATYLKDIETTLALFVGQSRR